MIWTPQERRSSRPTGSQPRGTTAQGTVEAALGYLSDVLDDALVAAAAGRFGNEDKARLQIPWSRQFCLCWVIAFASLDYPLAVVDAGGRVLRAFGPGECLCDLASHDS